MQMRVATLISVVAAWGVVQCSAAVHCQPGDPACAKCQASCDTIELGALPECCEVYSACCPTYSNQCRSCEANTAVDPHFPEYCCASFTDCCHLVPGLAPASPSRQQADNTHKHESQLLPRPDAVRAAESQTSQLQDEVVPSSTTLQARSIPKSVQDAGVQISPPAERGRLAAPAASRPSSGAAQLNPPPRTRQRPAAVESSSGNVRPTPAVRQTAEAASVNRRGRVTSRGRVVQ